jgi:hypothetical protein
MPTGACSTPGGPNGTSSSTGAAIELAVSKTCAEASDPHCVSGNGENVALPSAFERAGVEDAAVAEGAGQNAVGVTFDEDGAAVFHTLTKQAARAGRTARLVIKIGDELQAAVVVPQALEGDQVQIMLSPDESAQKVVDLIRGG